MMDQPEWIIHDFNVFGLLEQWLDIDIPTRAESDAMNYNVRDA